MKKQVQIVINPISGVGKQKLIEPLIQKHLNTTLFEYEIIYTERPGHIIEMAQNAAKDNIDIFAVVGGDGSVNEAAKGLKNSNTAMAIIPSGSGNGLARHLKIPMDLEDAIKTMNRLQFQKIDTVDLNNETFVNIAGIGFDAHIAHEFAKFGKRGFSSYVKVVMRELPKFKRQKVSIFINGEQLERDVFLMSFANGSQYGNNATIAPGADLTDGLLNVIVLKKISVVGFIPMVYQLFYNKAENSSYIEIFKTTKLEVIQQQTIAHLDGEPIHCGHHLKVELNPLSLHILVP